MTRVLFSIVTTISRLDRVQRTIDVSESRKEVREYLWISLLLGTGTQELQVGRAAIQARLTISTGWTARDDKRETMEKDAFTPAHLSFLSIYSPPLGPTDETFGHQVVFYYSRTARDAARASTKTKGTSTITAHQDRLSENEKLRQIGLAQGMAGFARYRHCIRLLQT
jgi:hypothetical protein